MKIKKVIIENFKSFKESFKLELSGDLNILVGNNEVGKSTILEAIHLALSGILDGNYLRYELSQYLFNNEVVKEYLKNLKDGKDAILPYILIELYFEGEDSPQLAKLEGDDNTLRKKASGISFKIEFDDNYLPEYEELIKNDLETIPIEFYKIRWRSFDRDSITSRSIPIKSILIDSSSHKYRYGSDIYISRIIKNNLNDKQKASISQAFRRLKEGFMRDESIKVINEQIKEHSNFSKDKNVAISVDLSTQNAWETTLMTLMDEVPFHLIGKGEQSIVKTLLALSHKKSEEANLILLEEPENHLTHTKLNQFLNYINENYKGKQIIVTTHSSFVANKLGLDNLTLLSSDKKIFKINELDPVTQEYFKKLSGYDTLRLILCKKAILVEGDSDELIVQKAFMDKNYGKLPIEKGIDVISVRSLAFKRFLEIAKGLNHPIAVVTDNDGEYEEKITKKYEDYKNISYIQIFADKRNEYNTLEPQIVDANKDRLGRLCRALNIDGSLYNSQESVVNYMKNNKTQYALSLFKTDKKISYPQYIEDVISWCNE
ncbi:MAG: ATP-dependent nuclease [Bacteroidota bacterium]